MATSDSKASKERTKRTRRIENNKTKMRMMDQKNNKSSFQAISRLLSNNCLSIWESLWRKTSEYTVVIDLFNCYTYLLYILFIQKLKDFKFFKIHQS